MKKTIYSDNFSATWQWRWFRRWNLSRRLSFCGNAGVAWCYYSFLHSHLFVAWCYYSLLHSDMMLLLASTLRHDVTNFSYATFLQQQLMVFVCVLFLILLLLLLFDDVTSRLYNRTFWQHFCSRDIDDSFSHPPRWPPWCPLWWRVSFCKNYLVEFSIFSSQQLHF